MPNTLKDEFGLLSLRPGEVRVIACQPFERFYVQRKVFDAGSYYRRTKRTTNRFFARKIEGGVEFGIKESNG